MTVPIFKLSNQIEPLYLQYSSHTDGHNSRYVDTTAILRTFCRRPRREKKGTRFCSETTRVYPILSISLYIMSIISMLTCRCEMLCRVYILQIQPRQHVLEDEVSVAHIPQRELDHTDQGYIFLERASSCSGNR